MEPPRIISVDDHVIEPPHLFSTWLPAKYRERGPQPLTAGIGELARLADMDLNHVEGSLCFPTFPRFCGQPFAEAHD